VEPALFTSADGLFMPTEQSRGVWDAGLVHGGPVCGLVGRAAEAVVSAAGPAAGGAGPGLCARLTVELFTAVPIAPLEVEASLVKGGRRTRVVDVEVRQEGRLLVRASSLWVAPAGDAFRPGPAPPSLPDQAADPGRTGWGYPRPGFNCDGVELRPLYGSTEESGPAAIWARLAVPLVAGEPTSRFAALAALSDLGAAVGWQYTPSGASLINPDVTLQLNRLPVDEWVLLDAHNHAGGDDVAFNEVVLSDRLGSVGRVLQTLVESPYRLEAAGAGAVEIVSHDPPTDGAG
jgi:acyl-coenzyme A thioesterase PaaI-like protein